LKATQFPPLELPGGCAVLCVVPTFRGGVEVPVGFFAIKTGSVVALAFKLVLSPYLPVSRR
jgi:hypothetical protein